MAMYFLDVKNVCYEKNILILHQLIFANMLVVSTIPSHESGVFRVNVEDQKKGMEEFGYLYVV